jgi:hypothetical protein
MKPPAPKPSPMVGARPLPISTVTDSKLPPPRGAGVGELREVNPIPRGGSMPRSPERAAPRSAGERVARTVAPGDAPVSKTVDGSDPNGATTSAPPSRFRLESIKDRHARVFKRMPDVGGTAPWQGMDRGGGVPTLPKPTLADTNPPHPGDVASGKANPRGLRQAMSAARRNLKRPTILRPGIGGLDVAEGLRMKPNTPGGYRGALRDIRTRTWHGTMAGHYTAPSGTVAASTAARVASPFTGPSVASFQPEDTESVSKALPVGAPVLTAFAADTGGSSPVPADPPSASGAPWGALLVAGVALFALSRG